MQFIFYSGLSLLVLFLSYKLKLSKAMLFSVAASVFVLIWGPRVFLYEDIIFVLFINVIPIVTENFKKDFKRRKEAMRDRFEKVKISYGDLVNKDKREMESNLEREKKLHQVLSLYEISKEMSICLAFEEIFNIFSSTLKKSFRFRLSRLVVLKESNDISAVYHIEIGEKVNRSVPNDFDKELLHIALETKKIISVLRQEGSHLYRRLSIVKDFETLISVPLFTEKRLTGILYVENITKAHFESFLILATQFVIQFQKAALYKKVEDLSIKDSLTEVSTRRYFTERFSEEIRRSMRHKSNLAFLMLDLDHFKDKNDKYGHLVGDVILKEVAEILKSSLREIDIIGRYGGEEFSIVLSGTGREGALQVAERIRESIESAIFKAYDEVVSTTVSIGLSIFPEDGISEEGLRESADRALYKAKEMGRNRVC